MTTLQMFPQPDVAIRAHAKVGEGPVFDRRTDRLCWVDLEEGLLFEEELGSGMQQSSSVGALLGAAAPRATEPGFAVAVSDGLGLFVNGQLSLVDAVTPEPFRRMNDAKCDSRGRLWAGSTHSRFLPGGGALHRWDGHAPSSVMATGFSLPNGIGWNAADTTMYLVDSMRHVLLSARYSAEDGAMGELATLAEIDTGIPDGLAVDVDGCIWVAIWGGYAVQRYSADGRLIGNVTMPVEKPSSCAFGPDGTLYITSATADIAEEDLQRQPLAGSVFALPTATSGVPVQAFAA